ncbi:MAG TPA: hypothetical protein VFR49_06770 [Solirubrobacteraceae bacterium]|nr:hypothetical protein [Solirubrobacteraceae bacterium]
MSLGGLIAGSSALGATAVSAVATTGPNSTPTIQVPPGPGPGVTNGPVPHVGGPSTVTAAQLIQLPGAGACVSRLRIGFAHPATVHLRTLGVNVGARHIVRRPVPGSLTIRQLPAGFFTLRVSVTTTASARFTRTRRYDRCG